MADVESPFRFSAVREPTTRVRAIIVGCGVIGLRTAKRLIDTHFCTRHELLLLDKQPAIGGLWSSQSFANFGARLQTPSSMYPITDPPIGWGPWPDFATRDEVLQICKHLVETYQIADRIRLGVRVGRVREDSESKSVVVSCTGQSTDLVGGSSEPKQIAVEFLASKCFLCVGDFHELRRSDFPEEDSFHGRIIYGNAELSENSCRGLNVVLIGMGAQAVENARTALLGGAKKVTILARRANMVATRFNIYIRSLGDDRLQRVQDMKMERTGADDMGEQKTLASSSNGRDGSLETARGEGWALRKRPRHPDTNPSAAFSYVADLDAITRYPYKICGVEDLLYPTPESLEYALWTGSSNTISDVFFIALNLGLLEVEIAEPTAFAPEGIVTSTGKVLLADLVIKNFGYNPSTLAKLLENITGTIQLCEPIWVSKNIFYFGAERNCDQAAAQAKCGFGDDLVNVRPGVTNISDYLFEVFHYFDQRPDELEVFLENSREHAAMRPRAPVVEFSQDTMLTMSQGLYAAMCWSPELNSRLQDIRVKFGSSVIARYSPIQFLIENEMDWRDMCRQLAGDPYAVPFVWRDLLEKLRITPSLLDHLSAYTTHLHNSSNL